MLTRPFSEESFEKNKQDEKERKEILDNLQGINLQIKTLSEKVIAKDRTKSNFCTFSSKFLWFLIHNFTQLLT